MPPSEVNQLLAGQESQPEVNRGRRLGEVNDPAGYLEKRLLQDVGWIDPTLQAAVHAKANHLLEPIMVLCEKCSDCVLIAAAGPLQKVARVACLAHDRRAHDFLTVRWTRLYTGEVSDHDRKSAPKAAGNPVVMSG